MQLPLEPRRGDRIEAELIARLIRYVRSITPRQGSGILVSTTPGGTTLTVTPRRGGPGESVESENPCPFDITVTADGVGDLYATFRAGTINNLLPDNYLSGVNVPASGTRFLVLSCTASSGEITAATFAALTDPPAAIAPLAGMPPARSIC